MSKNELVIIPKIEKYIEYMLTILIKLPRTEKFSIGTEIKTSMYEMLKYILLSSKVENLNLEKELKLGRYKPGAYKSFKVYEPKERTIMAATYRDRVVHQWYVENFIEPYIVVPQFIETTYAGIKGRGMHKASKYVQKAMKIAKNKWSEYYILKMDVAKYFQNIDKRILWNIIKRKIIMVNKSNFNVKRGYDWITTWKLYFTNVCKYLFE